VKPRDPATESEPTMRTRSPMPGIGRHRLRLVARALVLAAVGVVALASPAAADPPAPGDYASEVTSIDPPVGTIDIRVVGGDSFLVLEVAAGTEVVVIGYDDEPFLRVLSDGTVEQNANSPASYLNDDRYAEVAIPDRLRGVDIAALDPEWEAVGSGGTHAWHDHRVHWMAPNAPPAVPRGDSFDWSGVVPLVVDGERVEVSGVIHYREDVSPLPWIGAGLVAAAGGFFLLRGRSRLAAAVGAVGAVAAAAVAWATWDTAPSGVGVSPLPVIVAAVALGLSVVALLVPHRYRPILLLAVAATLGSWGLLRFAVLTNPVLPTDLSFTADRAATVAAMAVAVALGTTAMGSLSPPPSSSGAPPSP